MNSAIIPIQQDYKEFLPIIVEAEALHSDGFSPAFCVARAFKNHGLSIEDEKVFAKRLSKHLRSSSFVLSITKDDRNFFVSQHIRRYIATKDKFLDKVHSVPEHLLSDPKTLFAATEIYNNLLDTMRQHENMYGLHKMEYKHILARRLKSRLSGADLSPESLSKLSISQRIRLVELLTKMKKSEAIPKTQDAVMLQTNTAYTTQSSTLLIDAEEEQAAEEAQFNQVPYPIFNEDNVNMSSGSVNKNIINID